MQVLVLGSGAGPSDGSGTASRTRASVALSADGERWVLLNASPDIAQQLSEQPRLPARAAAGGRSFDAIVLMDAQIDGTVGLLSLRDGPPLEVYATSGVFDDLTTTLPILSALQHYCGVRWHLLAVAGEQRAFGFTIDAAPGLQFEAVAIAGHAPRHSVRRDDPAVGDTIALRVLDTATGRRLFYAPNLDAAGAAELALMADADMVLVGEALWRAPPVAPTNAPTHAAADPAAFDDRTVFAHCGIRVACDGMALTL